MKEFPWFKRYPAAVAHEIKLYDYANLVELFEESCKKYKDRVAFE